MSTRNQDAIQYVVKIEKSPEWSWQYGISVTAHLNVAELMKDKKPSKPLGSWDSLAALRSGDRDLNLERMREHFARKGASFAVSSPPSQMVLTYVYKEDEGESSDDVSDQDSDAVHEDDEEDDKTRIGSIHGTMIWRGRIRKKFWTAMEEPTEDLSALAFEIFTRWVPEKPNSACTIAFFSHPLFTSQVARSPNGTNTYADAFQIWLSS